VHLRVQNVALRQGINRGLALDLKPIRVNLVRPGGVDTELWNDRKTDERERFVEPIGQSGGTGSCGRSRLSCMTGRTLLSHLPKHRI
jgi:NAD(P)-dependent dehydrogenase (short-subunit alcohol dehydrogenase family)